MNKIEENIVTDNEIMDVLDESFKSISHKSQLNKECINKQIATDKEVSDVISDIFK